MSTEFLVFETSEVF